MCVGSSVAAMWTAMWAARKHGPVYFRVRGNKLSHRKLAINWQLGNFGQKQSQGFLIWKWSIEWCLICIFFNIWPDLKPEYHFNTNYLGHAYKSFFAKMYYFWEFFKFPPELLAILPPKLKKLPKLKKRWAIIFRGPHVILRMCPCWCTLGAALDF